MANIVYIPSNRMKHARAKKSKYGNKKCSAMGHKFDSVGERHRYFYLMEAQKRGQIRNLRCQVDFKLDVNGSHVCKYIADFVYFKQSSEYNTDWEEVVEDFKGMQTDVFKLKRKLMRACLGIEIRIVKTLEGE